ncbi:trafficking protein particle complex subunit 9-like [Liolophura sinensis]|uniref:trafficking protein particle complex subunit 9-like n=1 Tax=Liolophura sinensis TaxID=3198878 RepID=UPI003158EE3B
MSFADYSQTAEDHQSFLILVRHTGEKLSSKTFNRTWERIRKLRCVKVPGHDRRIYLRFKRAYPIENNEWGDFQAHRKVLGLLSVGSCLDVTEFQELFERYKKVKEQYSSTIFNSRLIVFGMNRDGTPLQDASLTNGDDDGSEVSESDDTDGNEPTAKFTIGSITPDTEDESKVPKENKHEAPKTATNNDSRRVPLAKAESFDSPSSPENPEGSFINGQHGTKSITDVKVKMGSNRTVDTASSGAGARSDMANGGVSKSGRPHSNSLTKDSRGAEVVFYPSTKRCADLEERLQEFAASLFFVLESKRLDRSFERSDKMQLLCTPFEKKDYVGVDTDTRSFKRRCQGRLRKHLADLSLQAGLPGEAILHYQTALDMLKSVNDWLWIGGCYEGLSSASVILAFPQTDVSPLKRNFSFSVKRAVSLNDSKMKGGGNNSMPNGMDLTREPKSGINPDDIIDKYREALVNYSKFKQAGVIEMEASLKACRILISQRKYLEASDFLQNVVYVNVQSMEEDKVQKYSSLSTLYTQIGFHRKAAFFKRIAAMQCVAPQIATPSWYQCYTLLLQAINGFSISLDPKEFLAGGPTGWPVLQLRVLNELVFSARKMGDPQLIIRHMAFLLHTMHDHLSAQDMREAVSTLESFTANCEGTPHPLAVENGLILPPVPMTHLPTVKSFKPLPLHPHLEPQKMSQKTPVFEIKSDNPFIYSPFTSNTNTNNNNATPGRAKAMMDFMWVAGDSCEVALHLSNPMADDLKITHMGLITEGVEFDTFPSTPSLPAESGPCLVKLVGMPKAAGELSITGYSTHVFGVRSFCKLKDIPRIENSAFQVEVVPSLPHIQLTTSLPKAASFFSAPEGANIVTSGTTALHAGQSQECTVTLQNVGNLPVDLIDVTLEDKYNTGILETVFSWNKENIISQLPLQPGSVGCFAVCIHGTSDFISNQGTDDDVVVSPARTFWGSRNVRSGTVTSLDGSTSDTVCLETVIRVQYSGGEGLEAGYCRHSSVGLSVDIQPSLAFSRWDVQPADSPEMCFLVLDGRNESRHDMEVRYGVDNSIVIEPNQVRRFAVKMRRINFPDLQGKDLYTTNLVGPVHAEGAGSSLLSDSEALKHSSLIASYVDIQWTVPILSVSGHASLDYLPWSSAQLAILQASPLHWDVTLNSKTYEPSCGVEVSQGELVSLDVQLTTDSDIPTMEGALLHIVCYQDNGNGYREYNTEEKVVTMGTNIIPLSEIASEDGFKHSCDFVFLTGGEYLLEVRCIMGNCDPGSELAGKPDRWTLLPAPKIIVCETSGNHSNERPRSSDPSGSKVKGSVQCLEERSICFPKENELHSEEHSQNSQQELNT